jgi:hypothetical protein
LLNERDAKKKAEDVAKEKAVVYGGTGGGSFPLRY